MPNRKMPAERGRGGHSELVLAGGSNDLEATASHIEYQYRAKGHLAEANGAIGGTAFAALALAVHFGRLAGGARV